MNDPLGRLAKHPSLWWVWGVEATLPISVILTVLFCFIALCLLLTSRVPLTIASGIALAPLLVIGLALSIPGVTRIASMYRAETLQVIPGLRLSLLVAYYQLLTLAITPFVLLALALQSLTPILLGMALVGVFLLSYWHVRWGLKRTERLTLVHNIASTLPTLMFISMSKLIHLQPDALTISIASALFFPIVVIRHIQLSRPTRQEGRKKCSYRLPPLLMRLAEANLLLRAVMLVGITMFYSRITDSGVMLMFFITIAYAIDDPNALRDRLQMHWLNGRSRVELISEAFKDALLKQGVLMLLTAAMLLGISARGLLPWSWLWPMLISMALSAIPVMTWQFAVIARVRRNEMLPPENMWHANILRASTVWVIFPWLIASVIFFALFQEQLPMFALACAVFAIVMTSLGVPVLRRSFQRIEL